MAMEVTNLKRKFLFEKGNETVDLPDPNAEFSAEEVMQFYSTQYPQLTTSTVDGPKIQNDAAVYEFKTTVGTKG